TVALSLGASFGLSVLVWQYLLGTQIHYVVLVMSVIVLLAIDHHRNSAVDHGGNRITRSPGNRRVSRPPESLWALDGRYQFPGCPWDGGRNRLRNIFLWSLSRGASGRRGPRNGLLHRIPRSCTRCLGFRFDDRRGNFVSELHSAALLPLAGPPVRNWHARH